jgi:hypothetical protein
MNFIVKTKGGAAIVSYMGSTIMDIEEVVQPFSGFIIGGSPPIPSQHT